MSGSIREYIIKLGSWQLKLKRAQYDHIEITEEFFNMIVNGEREVENKTQDQYEIVDVDSEFVEINFVRKQYYEPKMGYVIEVEIGILFELNQECKKEITLSNIKKEISERYDQLLMPAISKASLIISTLTNINSGAVPVITPPYLNEK